MSGTVADWRRVDEQPPTKADADVWGCIMAWHELQGVIFTNPDMIDFYKTYVHWWAHTPAGPEGAIT